MRLEVTQLFLRFPGQGRPLIDVSEETLVLPRLCWVKGDSGSGKTSFLRALMGWYDGRDEIEYVRKFGGYEPDIGYVGGHATLLPWKSVLKNLRLRCSHLTDDQVLTRLQEVGLDAAIAHAYPYELSLGMYKRVELLLSVLPLPDLLMLDEFFTSLDAKSRSVVQEFLRRAYPGGRILFTSHVDPNLRHAEEPTLRLEFQFDDQTIVGWRLD